MFKYSAITTKGLEAMNACLQTGDMVKITRLAYGDGEIAGIEGKTDDEIRDLLRSRERLINEKCTLKIFKIEKNEKDLTGKIDVNKVVGVVDNETVAADFYAREGGVYVEYNGSEILFAYYTSIYYEDGIKKDMAGFISKLILESRPHYWTLNIALSEAADLDFVFDTDFSLPTITPVKTEEGYNIEINDHLGKKQIFIKHGKPFTVSKVYASVEAMEADFENPDVVEGDFVVIETGNLEDPDNSKLYLKTETDFKFITDLSGAQGFTGPQGVGISKIEYTESLKDDDYNIAAVELTDGSVYQFKIKNGKTGDFGDLENAPRVDTLTPDDDVLLGVGNRGTKMSALAFFDVIYPVGVTYPQYPQCKSPMELWGTFSTWEVVDYGGAFFRAEGGNAEDFIDESGDLVAQAEGLPNIEGHITSTRFGSSASWDSLSPSKSGCFGGSSWTSGAAAADSNSVSKTTYVKFRASNSNSIYGNSSHVTPENYTYRIWKRIS